MAATNSSTCSALSEARSPPGSMAAGPLSVLRAAALGGLLVVFAFAMWLSLRLLSSSHFQAHQLLFASHQLFTHADQVQLGRGPRLRKDLGAFFLHVVVDVLAQDRKSVV